MILNLPSTEGITILKNIHRIQAKINLPVLWSLENKKYTGHIEGKNA